MQQQMQQQKFGELIRLARWRKRISQRAIAREIGVSDGTVGYWERGQREPCATSLVRIMLVLDLRWETVSSCFASAKEEISV